MNKILVPLLLFLLPANVFSQKFYIKPNAGYGIETFKKGFVTDSIFHVVYTDTITTLTKEKLNKFSLGRGWNAGITFGYKFNPNFGIEMGVSYCFGKPTSIEYSERFDFIDDPNHFVKLVGKNTYKSGVLSLSPSILITKPLGDFNPYLKIGGSLNYVFLKEDYSEKVSTTLPGYFPFSTNTSELKYKSSLTFGLLTSIGTEYQIGENFSVYIDIQNSIIYYSPKKAKLLNYFIDGENKINDLNINEREFVYVESYINNGTDNEPSKRIKNTFSLCNLSFNLGLKINLFKVKNK